MLLTGQRSVSETFQGFVAFISVLNVPDAAPDQGASLGVHKWSIVVVNQWWATFLPLRAEKEL